MDKNMKCSIKVLLMDEKKRVRKKRSATPLPKKLDQSFEELKSERSGENSKKKKVVRRVSRQRTPTKMVFPRR